MQGNALHYVGGGDRLPPLHVVTYSEPPPKSRGLDWDAHTAPQPLRQPTASIPVVKRAAPPRAPRPRPPRTRTPATATHPQIETMIQLYQRGATAPAIAETIGCIPRTVRTHLARAGIPLRDDRQGRSGGHNRVENTHPDLARRISQLYAIGLSQSKIGHQLGISAAAVRRIMRDHGITPRMSGYPGVDTHQRTRDWYAAHPDVTSDQVRAWAIQNGHQVADRGVIAYAVLQAFEEAHQ